MQFSKISGTFCIQPWWKHVAVSYSMLLYVYGERITLKITFVYEIAVNTLNNCIINGAKHIFGTFV